MRTEPTPARLRDMLDGAFARAAAAGADERALAAAALDGLLRVRRHLAQHIGTRALWQLRDWMADWLLRRELRAHVLGVPHDRTLPDVAKAGAAGVFVAHAVEAALAAIETAGVPVLYLALAELLLDRLEVHLGGLPARAPLLERLMREDGGAVEDVDVRTPLLQ